MHGHVPLLKARLLVHMRSELEHSAQSGNHTKVQALKALLYLLSHRLSSQGCMVAPC